MTTSPVRGLFAQAGRSSVRSCIRAGELTDPGLTADAQVIYDEMADDVTWPDKLADQGYLAVMVLPVAALYRTLRDRGWTEREAVDATRVAFLATGAPQRSLFGLLLRSDLGRRLFLRSLRPNWLWLTPPPSNEWRVLERSETRVSIEVTRCYRWDAFNLVGTPEAASVACAFEVHMMNASPDLTLTADSMATGADRCRFCFERHRGPAATRDRALRTPRRRRKLGALGKPIEGIFPNTMAYVRLGDGPKTLFVIPGGPGNDPPSGRQVRMMMGRSLRPLVESGYSLWMVARRRGMPHGHTIEDMAADYADLIVTEFDGKVDVVVGLSTGGLIGQYLAGNHPDRFDHIALVGAAHTVSEQGRLLDYDWAAARSRGDWTRAGRVMAGAMLTDSWLRWSAPALGTVMGRISRSHTHDQFASDVMVEAEAEVAFDAGPILTQVKVPVLLINGDKDLYSPVPLIQETARLIPDCTLKVYTGKTHLGVFQSRQLAPDILDFINTKPAAAT